MEQAADLFGLLDAASWGCDYAIASSLVDSIHDSIHGSFTGEESYHVSGWLRLDKLDETVIAAVAVGDRALMRHLQQKVAAILRNGYDPFSFVSRLDLNSRFRLFSHLLIRSDVWPYSAFINVGHQFFHWLHADPMRALITLWPTTMSGDALAIYHGQLSVPNSPTPLPKALAAAVADSFASIHPQIDFGFGVTIVIDYVGLVPRRDGPSVIRLFYDMNENDQRRSIKLFAQNAERNGYRIPDSHRPRR